MLKSDALFEISTLLLLAWGALAFGAEYAWAYAPLLAFSCAPAILGLRAARGAPPSRILMFALGLVFLAGILQVVVPARMVPASLQSPPPVDFGRLYALATMGRPPAPAGTLSIAPGRTILGLTFLAVFSLFLAGTTRGISARGSKRLIHGIVILGAIVSFVGLIQAAVRTETVYGFWRQSKSGVPFAPFMNENHFTGWMAMAMSLAIGSFAGDIAVAWKDVRPGVRNRLLWLSSQQASGMLMTAFGAAVMALSMVVATSRGGLVGLLLIFIAGLMLMWRRQAGWRRALGGLSLLLIIIAALFRGDAARTLDQFTGVFEDMGGRKEIWSDTRRVIDDYPVTGTGLNTFGIAMLHYQKDFPTGSAVVEAHNDYLQLVAEGGWLLGIPIVLTLGIFVWQIHRRFREGLDDIETYWRRAGAVTGLCAIAVMEMFDFTLQMPGAAAMFVVLAAIAIHRPNYLTAGRRAEAVGEQRP